MAESLSVLDEHVAPGLRLWMLIALVSGVLLVMVVLVCCFMRIRIPRTKRQIDLIAAKRKLRKKAKVQDDSGTDVRDERAQAIVMNSMAPKKNQGKSGTTTAGGASATPPPAASSSVTEPLIHKSGSKVQTAV